MVLKQKPCWAYARYGVDLMWPKLLHAENLEEEPFNPACLICSPPKMSNIQEHLRYGTFFWDVGAEVVLIRLHLRRLVRDSRR